MPVTTSINSISRSKPVHLLLWVFQLVLAAIFLVLGAEKMAGAPPMVAVFSKVGLGQLLRYLTGGLEMMGAIGLLVPKLAGAGAAVLSLVLVGAIIADLTVMRDVVVQPVILLLFTGIIAWMRRAEVLELLGY